MTAISKLTPFLWFDGQARQAAEFYVSLFQNSRILGAEQLASGPAEGSALVEFELEGFRFQALDGGPMYKFTPAVSFVIACDSQEEIDHFWDGFSKEGTPGPCGWIEDKFGLSWQVVPSMLPTLMQKNPASVTEALLSMGKLDIEQLRQASERR